MYNNNVSETHGDVSCSSLTEESCKTQLIVDLTHTCVWCKFYYCVSNLGLNDQNLLVILCIFLLPLFFMLLMQTLNWVHSLFFFPTALPSYRKCHHMFLILSMHIVIRLHDTDENDKLTALSVVEANTKKLEWLMLSMINRSELFNKLTSACNTLVSGESDRLYLLYELVVLHAGVSRGLLNTYYPFISSYPAASGLSSIL